MNTDTLSGKGDQIKGQVKQTVGEAVGNQDLANSGAGDQIKGNVKEAWGNVKSAFNANADEAKAHAQEHEAETKVQHEEAAHNIRQSVVNASEKVKDFVSGR